MGKCWRLLAFAETTVAFSEVLEVQQEPSPTANSCDLDNALCEGFLAPVSVTLPTQTPVTCTAHTKSLSQPYILSCSY